MWNDPIIKKIHKKREEHAREFNFDLQAMYDDWKKKEKQSGRKFVTIPIKRKKSAKKKVKSI